LITILVFDVGVSMVDFAIERASREFFGGLPTGEYILHVIMAMLFGALVTSVFYSGSEWAGMATQLIFEPAVPGVICGIMAIMVFAVFLSGAMDLVAAVRLSQESAHD
jgi:hypothetical protein